ncbi:MAG: hypothetical protein V4609_11980, partial [Pseudomonadota bacterium]
ITNTIVNKTTAKMLDTKAFSRDTFIKASDTATISNLGGALSISIAGKAIGGAVSLNTISNDIEASAASSTIKLDNQGAGGMLYVQATGNETIDSMAASGSGGEGTAVAASATTNSVSNDTLAGLNNVTVTNGAGGLITASDTSTINSLAGGAAISLAKNAVGGAGSLNTVVNAARATIEGASDLQLGGSAFTHSATNNATIRSAAVALAGTGDENAVAPVIAVNTITNTTQATASNSKVSAGSIAQSATDTSKIASVSGAAALSLGKNGVGIASSFNTIVNTASVGASGGSLTATTGLLSSKARNLSTIESIAVSLSAASNNAISPSIATNTVSNTTVADFSGANLSGVGVDISAATTNQADQSSLGQGDATIRTLSGAAAISFGGGTAVGGALSVNTVTNKTNALLSGGTIAAGAGAFALKATNDQSMKALAASAAGSSAGAGAGSASIDTITNSTTAKLSGGAIVTGASADVAAADSSIIHTIAGAVGIGLGGAGVGLAASTNTIKNTVDAQIVGGSINVGSGAAKLGATTTSDIRALAASVAGASESAGSGSVVINTINNFTTAKASGGAAFTAGNLAIKAKDTSIIKTLSGGVAISAGGTAVGIALANNYIGNATTATVDTASVSLTGALDVTAEANDTIASIAVSMGAGANGGAGSGTGNTVTNETRALLKGVTGTSNGGSTVASDISDIQTLAGAVAIGLSGAAVGGGVSVNTITNRTEALVQSTSLNAGTGAFTHTATNNETIKSLAAAGSAAAGVGVGISAATNTIVNKTHALMTGTTLTAGNVTQQAQDTATIKSLSGAAALAFGSAGVGFAASINTITNETFSGATGSSMTLSGTLTNATKSVENVDTIAVAISAAAGLAVSPSAATNTIDNDTQASYSGTSVTSTGTTLAATDDSTIRTLTGAAAVDFGGGGAFGGAFSINTVGNTTEALVSGGTWASGAGATSVTATNSADIKAIAASAAGSTGGAAAGSASVDTITNTTRAKLTGVTVTGASADVAASDTSSIKTIAGAAAVGLGGAGVGIALSTNTIVNTVEALISGGSVNVGSGAAKITATSNSDIQALAASAAGSSGITVSGSTVVNTIHNFTTAKVSGGTSLTAGNLAIKAKDTSIIKTLSGGVAIGGGTAVGIALANNYIGNATTATIDTASVSLTGALDVNAESINTIASIAVSLGAGPDAGAGSATGNTVTNETEALLKGVTGTSNGGSTVASDSSDIQTLAGAVAIGVSGAAVGGGISVNTITNTTEALVQSTSLNAGSGAFTHTATNNETIKSLAAAGSAAAGVSVGLSAATNTIVNKTHALMTGTTLTAGNVTQQAQDTATIQSLSGAAALAFGAVGVGFAASVNTITNETFSGATGSSMTLSGTLTNDTKSVENVDTIAVAISAAAGMAVSPSVATNVIDNDTRASYGSTSVTSTGTTIAASDDSNIRNLTGAAAIDFGGGGAVGGAASINSVSNTTEALIDGGTWKTGAAGSGALSLTATNSSDIKAIAVAAAISGNVGVAGSAVTGTVHNTTSAKLSTLALTSGGMTVKAEDTADIRMLAGSLGIGFGAVGVGAAAGSADIKNSVTATVQNVTATLGSGSSSVIATSKETIWSLAAAGSGGTGVAVSGSTVNNLVDNTTAALVDTSTLNATGATSITSSDTSEIHTLSGAAALSGGGAVGAASAVNVVSNDTSSRAVRSTINGGAGDITVSSTAGETIETMAVSGAAAGVAVSGSSAVNTIGNSTLAELDGASALATSGNVKVNATDNASIKSVAGAAAFGGGTSVGVASSVNTINNNIDARIRGVAASGLGGLHTVTGSNVMVGALSSGNIQSLAAGIAADASAGVAGSASINVIGTNTRTLVDRSADVLASNNVVISAESSDVIQSIAGSAGIGLAAAGVGVSSGVAVITGETSATVGGSDVSGKTKVDGKSTGSGATSNITNGELNSTYTVGLTNPSSAFVPVTLATGTKAVQGVAVTALAKRNLANGSFSVGGGSVGVAATLNANAIVATTSATITGADVNQRTSGAAAAQDVNVLAASHTYGSGFAGAVGVGAFAGVGAAIEGSGYNVTTQARVLNSNTTAQGNATVKARATEGISTLDAGGSVGLVGVQGTGSIGIMRGRTDAVVYGGSFTSDDLTVKADHDAAFGSIVGAVAGGVVGVAGSFGILVNAHTTTARIGASTVAADNETANTSITSNGNVVVDAESQTNISQSVVSGSIGGYSFAGAVSVMVLDDTALATVNKTTMNALSGNVTIESSVDTTVQQIGGAAAIGFGAGGTGAAIGLALARGQADSWIANSTVTANNVTVDAKNTQDVDALAVAGGADLTGGIGGSIQITMIGLGSSSTSSKSDSEISAVLGGSGALTKANSFSTKNRLGGQQSDAGTIDETNSAKTGFSTTSKNTVNSANSYDFMAKMNTPLANTTRARITNSTIATTTATTVAATSETALRNTVGAAGLGLGYGVAGAISVAKVSNLVDASVDSLSLLQGRSGSKPAINVTAIARDKSGTWTGGDGRDTILSRTGAAAGAVGLAASASVSVGLIDNNVSANLDAASLGGGNVTLASTDSSNARSEAYGAGVGLAAAGVAVAVLNRSGEVTADFTPTGNSTITKATIGATANGTLAASVKAAAAGVGLAASGNAATVTDSQKVAATIGSAASFSQTGGLSVKALHSPKLSASVAGISVSAGLQIGVAVAKATFSGDTTASVAGTGNFGAGAVTVTAQNAAPASGYNLEALAYAAGGGLLLGANGAIAEVSDSSNVTAEWKAAALPMGSLSVDALRDTSQHALGTANSGGIIALGAVYANSNSTGNTNASIKNLTATAVTLRTTDLTVNADAKVTSRSQAVAGTGGVIAGSAAIAATTMTGQTNALLDADSANAYIRGTNVTVKAQRLNDFNGRVDTVSAAVVGSSGSIITNTINTSTSAAVGGGTSVNAGNFTMTAKGKAMKDWWDGSSDGMANIKSGSGGVIDAPAAVSTTDYRQTTAVSVGDSASITTDLVLGSNTSVIKLDASSDITLRDRVVMNSGGAIPVATGVSKQVVNQDDNSVTLAANAILYAPLGDIKVGSRTVTDLDARVAVDTYGLAGAPDGTAWARYTGGNTVTLAGASTVTTGRGNILMNAGADSSGNLNKFLINSDVHTWNKTAIPIAGGPDASSRLTTNNTLTMASGSLMESAADINLGAYTGTDDARYIFGANPDTRVTSVGIGKDVYRELAAAAVSAVSNAMGGGDVSFDIKKSEVTRSTTGVVNVDGTVRVGANRFVDVVISEDVTGSTNNYTVGSKVTTNTANLNITTSQQAVGQEVWARIQWLRDKERDYAGTAEATAYANERNFLEGRLVAQGLAVRNATTGIVEFINLNVPSKSQYELAQAQLLVAQAALTPLQTEVNTSKVPYDNTLYVHNKIIDLISTGNTIITEQAKLPGLDSAVTTAASNLKISQDALAAFKCATTTCTGGELTTISNLTADVTAKTTAKTTADTNLTNERTTINNLITTYNTIQGDAKVDPNVTNVTVTNYTSNTITSTLINTLTTEKNAYDTSKYNPAKKDYDIDVTNYNNVTSTVNTITTRLALPDGTAPSKDANGNEYGGSYSKTVVTGPTQMVQNIPDITVQLSDINIFANQLTGKGSLSAPGDAKVTITNNSSSIVKVNNISVSAEGAEVRLNGFLVNDNAEINKINAIDATASGATLSSINTRHNTTANNGASVTIKSNYNPANETRVGAVRPAPDIILNAGTTIFNPDGLVQIVSEAGSIYSQGTIRAGVVDITSKNGDFVQSYQNGFFNVGADPQARQGGATPIGIMANGAILLSARYLNINGNVQSGITDYTVNLPSSVGNVLVTGSADFFGVTPSDVLAFRAAYLNNRGSGTVTNALRYRNFSGRNGMTVSYDAETDELYATYNSVQGNVNGATQFRLMAQGGSNLGATYDATNDQFIIDGAAVKSGYIKLFGQIMNTESSSSAGGHLKVSDGYGSITVNNTTGKKTVLRGLDAGSGASGVVEISDIQTVNSSGAITSLKN